VLGLNIQPMASIKRNFRPVCSESRSVISECKSWGPRDRQLSRITLGVITQNVCGLFPQLLSGGESEAYRRSSTILGHAITVETGEVGTRPSTEWGRKVNYSTVTDLARFRG
jgi:hypothetical protein